MKEQITVSLLLESYKTWVEKDEIQFLRGDPKGNILKYIDALISIMKLEEQEPEQFEWHKAHQEGRKLWEELASFALNHIDSASKGNSTLFNFLTAATEFEDILYGVELYYRDHTLHSLWVYIMGEYILRNQLEDVHNDLNWYLYNDIKKDCDRYSYPESLVKYSEKTERDLTNVVTEYRDAIWCIIALCHDLGYSLAKLSALNDKVKAVLKYFDIPDFRHIGYSLDIEHQYLVSQFLELMAMDVRIVPGEGYKELEEYEESKELGELETPEFMRRIEELSKCTDKPEFLKKLEEKTLIKCYRDDATYWLLCRALEKKQHGILSSYLIYKILGIFADASVRGPAEEWGLDDEEAKENIIRGDILFAIAQHEFEFAYLDKLSSLADILVLADELEEFSRHGRELLSRKYYPTMAYSQVTFKRRDSEDKKFIRIEIVYEVKEPRNLIDFFILKAERLCRLYSLDENVEKSEFRIIEEIRMTTKKIKDSHEFSLSITLNRDPDKTKVLLPKNKDVPHVKGGYKFKCYDDKIHVFPKGQDISLSNWFRSLDGDYNERGWIEEKNKWVDVAAFKE